MSDVAVIVEVMENKVQDNAYELFGKAQELADVTGGKSVAIVMGNNVEVDSLPCDKVYYVEDDRLEAFSSNHKRAISKVVEELNPRIILAGNSSVGTDLGVHVSGEHNIPIASLCNAVSIDGDDVKATSLAYGGKLLVDLKLEEKAVILVNRGSFSAAASTGSPEVTRTTLDDLGADLDDSIQFVEYVKPEEDVDISKFDVLVSVGRGIDGEENIEEAQELAEMLSGEVSASRPVIDQEWLPKSRQVGRSGKTVTPKLYFALGISGASEHLEGVKAQNVVAINTDSDAPIFRVSRVGVVMDLFELLPVLKDKIKEIKG
ncbi:MAG: electron transfer flavoprotein subunit alpha/FixB family protein [Archaeoglobaceae archaeon]